MNLRTLLGIRRRRALLPAGPKPRPGARIFCGEVRLTLKSEMPDSLWQWLSRLGWREITYRPDRRRYDDIPEGWTNLLYEARPEQRARVLLDAVVAARKHTPHPEAFRDAQLKRQTHRLAPARLAGA